MRKYMGLFIAALFCCPLPGVSATGENRTNPGIACPTSDNNVTRERDSVTVKRPDKKGKERKKKKCSREKNNGTGIRLEDGINLNLSFSNEGKPIREGDSVIVKMTWDSRGFPLVSLENGEGPVNGKGLEGEYSFVIRPGKDTTCNVKMVFSNEGEPVDSTGKNVTGEKKGKGKEGEKKLSGIEAARKEYSLPNALFITIPSNEGKPIQKGDSVTIHVVWDTQWISRIVFENVYEPSEEEARAGEYTLVVKPEKTTRYKVIRFYTDGTQTYYPEEIKVLDKNGREIRGEDYDSLREHGGKK